MKNMLRKAAALLLAVMMCLGASGCMTAQPEKDPWEELFEGGSFDESGTLWLTDDPQFAGMNSELEEYCVEKSVGSVLVATDDKVIFAGGFNASEADGSPADPYTVYEIGSVTKQFCAAAILQQIEAGRIHPDDTIDKYFPDYPHGSEITVDNLLHMSSGLTEMLDTTVFFSGAPNEDRMGFRNGTLSDEKVLEYLGKLRLNFKPGSIFSYCNTNYWLLALILEQVTGQTYEEYVAENFLEPFFMKHTSCCSTGDVTAEATGEYMLIARNARGAGDIHSNVCDILLWDRALFGGKILGQEQLDYMTEMKKGYGCGQMSEGENHIFHSGSTWSFVTMNSIYTAEGIGRVYVIQMTGDSSSAGSIDGVEDIVEKHLGL